MRALTEEERYVFFVVCPQSACGVIMSGLFYGWGSLADAINERFSPDDHTSFANLHGNFAGIIILMLSVMPMPFLRLLLDAKVTTEFQVQLVGALMCTVGLFLGGVSLQVQSLPLLYLGCAVPCGFGGLGIYQRLVFIHQLWFKRIGKQNLGAGIFGGLIGFWTVLFFLLSSPILAAFPVATVLYIYAAVCPVCMLNPVFFAKDVDSSLTAAAAVDDSATAAENKPLALFEHDANTNDPDPLREIEENRKPMTLATQTPARSATLKTEPVPIRDPVLLALAASQGVAVDSNGEFELTYGEIGVHPMTWVLTLFFTTILTPGWGIKLGSIAILRTFFHASVEYAAKITAMYVSFYCVGRFFGGLLAERIGAFRAYDILLVCMLLCLVVAPQATMALSHSDVESFGCQMFVGLICVVGLMYGGCVALFYSIVFDVFGAKNYRRLFGFNMQGFGLATAIGGLSCAYSFSQPPDPSHPDAPGQAANQWFYAMAGATLFGHVLLHVLRPLDFNKLLHRRLARIDPSYVPLRKVRPGPRAAAPAAVNAAAVNGTSHA